MSLPETTGALSLIPQIPGFYKIPVNTQSWFLFLRRKRKRRGEERRERVGRGGEERTITSLSEKGPLNKPNPAQVWPSSYSPILPECHHTTF